MQKADAALAGLAVGDADNDNNFEIYGLGQNNHVYQIKFAAPPTPTPTATPQVTATPPPPAKILKVISSQINPAQGEQAIVRWSQPQSGQATITLYTLLGDKVITLVDHQNYPAGEYNEVKWNGRNADNEVCASGIYIVLIQAPGYSETTKIAIIK